MRRRTTDGEEHLAVFKPVPDAEPNTLDFETFPLIKTAGFCKYGGLWWFGFPGTRRRPEINLLGAQMLGMAFATMIGRSGGVMDVVTGHDFRSYSLSFKLAFTSGLITAGARVKDIGLAIAPMIGNAQSILGVPYAVFVTALHHENGWIGVKFGTGGRLAIDKSALDEMKELVASADFEVPGGGSYEPVTGLRQSYLTGLTQGAPVARALKVVVASANGTAGIVAPQALEQCGCHVVGFDIDLDYTFPRYLPDPKDPCWLAALERKVVEEKADIGFAFDGAGEWCGVVGNDGKIIPSSKIALLLAREIAASRAASVFVVEKKWKKLFDTDPVLQRHAAVANHPGAMSRYVQQTAGRQQAFVEFRQSGRFRFNPPLGRGCEDGLLTALLVCRLLDHHADASITELCSALPPSFGSDGAVPTAPEDLRHYVVEHMDHYFRSVLESGGSIAGQKIIQLQSVNGVKIVTEDGTWARLRATSEKAELVVMVESPVSDSRRQAVFDAIDAVLRSLAASED